MATDSERQNKDIYISEDCKITGTIEATGNLNIDGKVQGTINIKGDLVIGKGGKVAAEILADNVQVYGEVRGNINATNMLDITSSGMVYGDIKMNLLKIEQGGRFVGASAELNQNEITETETDKETNDVPENLKSQFIPKIYNRLVK